MNMETLSEKILDLEKRVAVLEASKGTSALGDLSHQKTTKKMSAKEFLLSKNLKSTVDKTLVLAYYLEKNEQMDLFNINDIASVFQAAREKAPANLNDMINKNIAKGYLMEAREQKDSKKAWVLTSTGEKFIEEELKKFN